MNRQCLGRTKALQRCGRFIDGWFCGDHSLQPIGWFVGGAIGLIALLANLSTCTGYVEQWFLRRAQSHTAIELNSLLAEGRNIQKRLQASYASDLKLECQNWALKVTSYLRTTYPQYEEHFNNDSGFSPKTFLGSPERASVLIYMDHRMQRLSEILLKAS